MTSHHDVAARLRDPDFFARTGTREELAAAADLLESQAKALSEAEALINAARDSAVDARMNAFKWMERHDRIAAGKDGGPFPKPADLPEAIARALAAEARLADKEAELSIARQINHDRDFYHNIVAAPPVQEMEGE